MRGTDVVTKLSKLEVSRIALCKSPADQDAVFVVVKSEDDPVVAVEPEAPKVDVELAGDPAPEKPIADEPPKQEATEPEVAKEEVVSEVAKEPVPSESRTAEFAPTSTDDGMKDCIKGLVDKCNESRAVPKNILKMIGEVAKYHGVEGPDMEGEDAFAEVTAQLRTVVDILKGLAITMAKPAPAAPEAPEKPASPPAKPKPAPAKKSLDELRAEKHKAELAKVRFELLKALGKDPCPPGE